MIRRLWRFIRRLILVVLAFALIFPPLYNLVVPEQRGTPLAMPEPSSGKYRVFVADWGYHTSILVEQPRGWVLGPPGKERAPILEYSWGDRLFYMQSDYRPHALFATLVLPTATVAYLDGSSDPPSFAGARAVYTRTIDATTLHTLLIELERTFKRASDGTRLAPYPVVSGYDGRFYPAYGQYIWTRDCNWWTVTRLAAAHLASAATGTLFSGQIAGRLRGFQRVSREALR
jgi:hypothetical protein